MRPASGVLHIESFDDGFEAIYGPRWKSTVPGQCYSLKEGREDMT